MSPVSIRPSSPNQDRTRSQSPSFADPPPAYTPVSVSTTTGARHNRLHKIQLESSSSSGRLVQTPTSSAGPGPGQERPWRWQWRWKSDHLLTRNERKTVRWVAENANIYDLGDAWSNLVSVLDGSGGDGEQADEGQREGNKDLEAGGDGQVMRRQGVSLRRCLRWFWPGEQGINVRAKRYVAPAGPHFRFFILTRYR